MRDEGGGMPDRLPPKEERAKKSDRGGWSVDLDPVRETFERWGREDPMYVILTDHSRRGNRWDPQEFFQRGRAEIATVMEYLGGIGAMPTPGRALDFGCGVGRLTQALAERFDRVVGVDIADTMVEAAEGYNRHGDRVRYLVNTEPDLALLEDDGFDFVYTSIVLQHIPPLVVEEYVREFFRVLRPGGVAVFQMKNGPRVDPDGWRGRWYTFRRRILRRLWKRMRGRAAYEMHWIARSRMEEVVAESGAELIDVLDLSDGRERDFRYCARVPGPPSVVDARPGDVGAEG